MGESRLVNRNINATAGRTSMRLEPEFWDALHEICNRESLVQAELIREIEQNASAVGRTSAVRVHILQYFRSAAEGMTAQREGVVVRMRPSRQG